jgi:hypothetical protein
MVDDGDNEESAFEQFPQAQQTEETYALRRLRLRIGHFSFQDFCRDKENCP